MTLHKNNGIVFLMIFLCNPLLPTFYVSIDCEKVQILSLHPVWSTSIVIIKLIYYSIPIVTATCLNLIRMFWVNAKISCLKISWSRWRQGATLLVNTSTHMQAYIYMYIYIYFVMNENVLFYSSNAVSSNYRLPHCLLKGWKWLTSLNVSG